MAEEKNKEENMKVENTEGKVEENKTEKVEKNKESIEEKPEDKTAPKSAEKKKERNVEAVINIYSSYNNTIAHVTDMSGRTVTKVTGGMVTKHSRLKANPTIAMYIAKRLGEAMREKGIRSVYVKIRAKTGNPNPGPGANAIVKSLSKEGFKILNILDVTRVPRGGPKKKGGRRGRRV